MIIISFLNIMKLPHCFSFMLVYVCFCLFTEREREQSVARFDQFLINANHWQLCSLLFATPENLYGYLEV